MTRTENATRNIFFGFLYKLEATIVPFITRTILIYFIGEQYVGLGSLFTSILSFFSLAELGIGNALVFSMYKPIAEKDNETLGALLNFYRKIYRIIGLVIIGVGLLLIPLLPLIIKDYSSFEASTNVNILVLYLVYLLNSSMSYLLFGYKQSLLMAHQRNDIISKRSAIIQLIMNVIQITVICIFRNYYIYIIFLPLATIATNITNHIITNRMYPDVKCEGNISKEQSDSITKKTIALFGTKANSIVLHASDNIVISMFLGVTMVGIFGNYYYIMNAIVGVMTIIYSSLTAGLGNSLLNHDKEKIYNDFNILTFLNNWLITICSCCFICLYQPFVYIWVGEELMLTNEFVILLVIYFYIYQSRRIVLTYKDAGGIWWEDRFRPYIVCAINLILNVVLVQFIGIYGIVISTIVSMIVSIPIENSTIFKNIFDKSALEYYGSQVVNLIVVILSCIATFAATFWLPQGIVFIFVRLIICLLVSNLILFIMFSKNKYFIQSIELVKTRILKIDSENKKIKEDA